MAENHRAKQANRFYAFSPRLRFNKMKIVKVILPISLFFVSCGSPTIDTKRNETENEYKSQKTDTELHMKDVLSKLSKAAIDLGDYPFEKDSACWIGYNPATDEEIKKTESRLGVNFPSDFKEFMKISNGFPATSSIEPSFLSLSKIDYTKNIDPFLIKLWTDKSVVPTELAEKYERSITIGGINEEQMFMLIPPANSNDDWEYWKFANWIPGEEPYPSLKDYFLNVIEFCKEEIKEN